MTLINIYRGTRRYGNNKEKENCDNKRTLSFKRLTNRTKVDRDRKVIETSEIISSNCGKIREQQKILSIIIEAHVDIGTIRKRSIVK